MTRISWKSLGISPWYKKEIMAFCRRYDDWRKELQYGLRAVSTGSGGSRGNAIGRPTEQQAIRNAQLRSNILLIEKAIRDVCPQMYNEMLDNITRGIPFGYLELPYTERDFYTIRIKVYALIAERREKMSGFDR